MKNRICLLSLLVMLTSCLNVFAAPIKSYQEFSSALDSGSHFVITLDLKQCTGNPNMPKGYFTPNGMMFIPATKTKMERVVTSYLHFTDQSGSPTYEYIKCTFNSDNSVEVRVAVYNPVNFTVIGSPQAFNCSIGQGIEINSCH
jgi:hypothetical protein